jgi:hypothetical protein
LHAYNIFFQAERQRILAKLPEPPPERKDDGTKEKGRRRRATHGKISFSSLAKEIGQKWHTLDKKEKEHFQKLADIDLKRYDDEMEVYNQQQTQLAKGKGNDQPREIHKDDDQDDDDDDDDNDESSDSVAEATDDTSSTGGAATNKKRKIK